MLVTESGIVTDVISSPFTNSRRVPLKLELIEFVAHRDMSKILIFVSVKLLQSSNALFPMLVTESGIVTDVRPLQPQNALLPMRVTEFGIVTDVRPLQPANADAPMLVTESGIVKSDISIPFRKR